MVWRALLRVRRNVRKKGGGGDGRLRGGKGDVRAIVSCKGQQESTSRSAELTSSSEQRFGSCGSLRRARL